MIATSSTSWCGSTDLIKVLEAQGASAIESARLRLLLEKRAFMADARAEVQPQRRRDFLT